ncbi:hypothetical protein [Streptomyces litchfieldiae]|uniref:Uncharacterized protein n=1 Tax=Streptomyces litchfieldiae TaxID=3075543 RepID=A0ABU2MUG0_9ACTN|nr:hypothetical protein [Streptomyces sp. DSM 44938]MDT0345042.1 hypothetical protein [Streptomyces sp. DSM 44938]
MTSKKMEGNVEQRRRAALDAERAGERPSARGATTGASKQRTHRPSRSSLTHEEKTDPIHRGKQRREAEERAEARGQPPPAPPTEPKFPGRGRPGYGPEHERVFEALGVAERRHGGEGVYATEIARTAKLPDEQTRLLLRDLVAVHGLVTELQGTDSPDLGARYETKPRR